MVRAKFKVASEKKTLYGDKTMVTVELNPVYAGSTKNEKGEWVQNQSENTKFWNATPFGKIELGCINLEAANQFELGKEYYIDFTPAP